MFFRTGTILRVLRDERRTEPFEEPLVAVAIGEGQVFVLFQEGEPQTVPVEDLDLEPSDKRARQLHLRRRRAFELPKKLWGVAVPCCVLVEESRGRWETFVTRRDALESLAERDRESGWLHPWEPLS